MANPLARANTLPRRRTRARLMRLLRAQSRRSTPIVDRLADGTSPFTTMYPLAMSRCAGSHGTNGEGSKPSASSIWIERFRSPLRKFERIYSLVRSLDHLHVLAVRLELLANPRHRARWPAERDSGIPEDARTLLIEIGDQLLTIGPIRAILRPAQLADAERRDGREDLVSHQQHLAAQQLGPPHA